MLHGAEMLKMIFVLLENMHRSKKSDRNASLHAEMWYNVISIHVMRLR